jgi:general secretion pathway protein G
MVVKVSLVLIVFAILARMMIPRVDWPRPDDQLREVNGDISAIVAALTLFKEDTGYFPKTSDGLDALIVKPHEAKDTWKGPYIQKDKIPLDPWNRPYVYVSPGEHNPDSFDVYSKGKNGLGGKHAIGNWED